MVRNIVTHNSVRDKAYDQKPKQAHPLGRSTRTAPTLENGHMTPKATERARCILVARLVNEWESACTAGDVTWQCHVIAEMCAAGGIGLAVSWEREIG